MLSMSLAPILGVNQKLCPESQSFSDYTIDCFTKEALSTGKSRTDTWSLSCFSQKLEKQRNRGIRVFEDVFALLKPKTSL